MRVAVIGATGQLGSDLVRVFREVGDYEVSPLNHQDIECTDPHSVRNALSKIHPDVVVNCAAFVRVDECEDRPDEAFRVNAIGALHVARTCAELRAKCVYIGTDYVFDGERTEPYTEDDCPRPINVYGASKLAGELLTRMACDRHFIVRTSGLYGVRGSRGKGGNFVETVVGHVRQQRPVRVVADQVLTPTYTEDLAQALAALARTEAYGLYHITNQGQCSWYEFALGIFRLLDLDPNLTPTTTELYGARARRPAYSVLTSSRWAAAKVPELRVWREALRAYLTNRGYLQD